ncbi:DUF4328 domain-containing protein [Ilumatobacter sp.]|uniref:DUF4328 domain-containing protein n=1 Tax=Ilumatobacter sp. TaxID=1967498 RepID=UPI0037513201
MAPPPGYVAYGSAPTATSTQQFNRIGGLSTAITVVVGIAGAGALVNGFIQSSLQAKATDFINGTTTRSEFEDSVVSSSAISAVAGIAMILGAILVMIWMFRITSNLRKYGMSTTWHPLFAVFGWMLPPGVLFVIPALMLREQWIKSAPQAQAGAVSGGSKDNPLLLTWWLFFGLLPLIMLGVSANSIFTGFGDTSTEAVAERFAETGSAATMIGAVGSLIAAVVFIMFSRQLTARHRSLTGEN